MSWNILGNSIECINALADQLETNLTLFQLDLSHNSIKESSRD